MTKKLQMIFLLVMVSLFGLSCQNTGLVNFFAPLGGQVNIVFINETPFRVITYWGGYDNLDPAVDIDVRQLKLESGEQSPAVINCTRRIEIAGESLRQAVEIGKPEGVEPDDINDKIAFSDVLLGEDNDEEATAGEGDSKRFLLGVDYHCEKTVEIRFQQDADTGEFTVTIFELEE